MFMVNKHDGYIVGVVSGVGTANSNATEEEYLAVKALLLRQPEAPEGYLYRLKENLEWELCAMPVPESSGEAMEADYVAALKELGVSL